MTAREKPAYHYARRKKFLAVQPDPLELRSCPQHKIAYKTKRVALQKAACAFRECGKVLSAYKCPHCRWWHLTSQVRG